MTEPVPATTSPIVGEDAAGRVIAGTFWNVLANALPPFFTFAVSVVAARALGPAEMGRQSYIAWTSISLITLFASGIPRALLRYVSKTLGEDRPGLVRGLMRWAWQVEAVGALVGGAFLIAVGAVGGDLFWPWALAGVSCSLAVMQAVPNAVLGALQHWRASAIIGLLTGAVGTVTVIIVLLLDGGIAGIFAVEVAVNGANLVLAGIFARRHLDERIGDAPAEDNAALRSEVLRYAWVASIQTVFSLVVWRRSELFFLNRYSTAEQLALYSIPSSVVWAIQQLPSSVGTSLIPAVATLLGAGEHDRIRTGVGRAMRLSIFIALPMTAGALALAPPTLEAIYGDGYEGLGEVLVVLLVSFPVVMVAKTSGSVLQAFGRIDLMLRTVILATAIDIVASVALVPAHDALGAAIANSLAQLVAAVVSLVYTARLIHPTWEIGRLVRALLASIVMGLAAWAPVVVLDGPAAIVVGFVLGSVTFVAIAAALDVLTAEDGAWFRDRMASKLPGAIGTAAVKVVDAWTAQPRPPQQQSPRAIH